jgi:hypothetical protein
MALLQQMVEADMDIVASNYFIIIIIIIIIIIVVVDLELQRLRALTSGVLQYEALT